MKRSHEAFVAYLQGFEKYCTDTAAAKAAGVHRMTISRWLSESREAAKNENTSTDLHFEFGGSVAYLHEHRKQAEKNIVGDIIGGALARARDGIISPTLFQGRRVPKIDYARLAKGDLPPERCILVDPVTGEPEYEEQWTPPSNELVLGTLAAFTKRFSKRQHIEHDHRHSGGIGVMVANQNAPRERLPMVEVIEPVAEAAITDASHVLEPGEMQPEVIATPASEPEPAPPPPPPKPSAPLSELQLDLIRRAREKGMLP